MWSVVYLILLNFAAFLPCTACVALSSDAHTGAGTQGESGAVQLLQVVLAALRDLLSSDSAVSVRKVLRTSFLLAYSAYQYHLSS